MGRTASQNSRAAPGLPAGAPKVRLSITGTPKSATKELAQPVMLIGGRRDCDLPIQHNDVSQVHCAVVNTGRDILVADLSSRTGTFVNEKRVSVATLRSGDKLRVGSVSVEAAVAGGAVARSGRHEDPTRLATPLSLRGESLNAMLENLPAVIGRRAACPVVIDTPDVSLAHALLLLIGGCPALFDLGSRSGTYVNGQRAALTWLSDGDELSIGGVKLRTGWMGQSALTPSKVAAPAAVAAMPAMPARATAASARAAAPPSAVVTASPQKPAPAQPTSTTEITMSLNPSDELDAALLAIQAHAQALRVKTQDRSAQLDRREIELTRKAEAVASESEQYAAREAALKAREDDLSQRMRELLDRENAAAETARKIDQFKSMLQDASSRLSNNAMSMATTLQTAPLVDRPLFGAWPVITEPSHR